MVTNNSCNFGTGTFAGEVLTSNGAGVAPTFQAASGGGGTTVTKFTASGTWTKAAGTKYIEIFAWGGGSGGGSGAKYLVDVGMGLAPCGGGGGSGSGTMYYFGTADFFGATETVTIGAAGVGGAAITTDDTVGNDGSPGGFTSIGNLFTNTGFLQTFGGAGVVSTGGNGGSSPRIFDPLTTTALTSGGMGGRGGAGLNVAAGAPGTDCPSASSVAFTNGPGGGGGGIDFIDGSLEDGYRGGNFITNENSPSIVLAGGTAGLAGGAVNGGNGLNASSVTSGGMFVCGTGGGGGASSDTGNAGNGGNGGIPGGGGGGGGASIDGAAHDSGKGGDGARGELWVIEYA